MQGLNHATGRVLVALLDKRKKAAQVLAPDLAGAWRATPESSSTREDA